MEVINKTFNVYPFSELSESAKQTAIDGYRNDENYPDDCYYNVNLKGE